MRQKWFEVPEAGGMGFGYGRDQTLIGAHVDFGRWVSIYWPRIGRIPGFFFTVYAET